MAKQLAALAVLCCCYGVYVWLRRCHIAFQLSGKFRVHRELHGKSTSVSLYW